MKVLLVSPVEEAERLPVLVRHYQAMGIDRIVLHVHDESGDGAVLDDIRASLSGTDHTIGLISQGPISDPVSTSVAAFNQLMDLVCGPGDWVIPVDPGELVDVPVPLDQLITACESRGVGFVSGTVIDPASDAIHGEAERIILLRGDLRLTSLYPRWDARLKAAVVNGSLTLSQEQRVIVRRDSSSPFAREILERRLAAPLPQSLSGLLWRSEAERILAGFVAGAPVIQAPKPRIAVITPYHRRDTSLLEQAHGSVTRQTIPATPVLVADGIDLLEIRQWPGEHFLLPEAHRDFGDMARGLASLSCFARGYDLIAYLDSDNAFEPEHLESMVRLRRDLGLSVVASGRRLIALDGTELGPCIECDGIGHVDTNCLMLDASAMAVARLWTELGPAEHAYGDRAIWRAVWQSGLAHGFTQRYTVRYRTRFKAHYRWYGVEPPEGTVELVRDRTDV